MSDASWLGRLIDSLTFPWTGAHDVLREISLQLALTRADHTALEKELSNMTRAVDQLAEEVRNLKEDFDAYTTAAGRVIQEKIDAAVAAAQAADDATVQASLAGIREVADALVANTPVPTPEGGEATSPVAPPAEDPPAA